MRNLLILLQILTATLLFSLAYSTEREYAVEDAFPNLSFTDPVGIYHPSDDTDRLFVLEQPGTIKVFSNDPSTTSVETFHNIP